MGAAIVSLIDPFEPKRAYLSCRLASIVRMLLPIEHGHLRKVERTNPVEASDIYAILSLI